MTAATFGVKIPLSSWSSSLFLTKTLGLRRRAPGEKAFFGHDSAITHPWRIPMIPRHDSYQKVSDFMCPRSILTSLGGHIPNIGTSYFGIATLVASLNCNYGDKHVIDSPCIQKRHKNSDSNPFKTDECQMMCFSFSAT